MSIAIFDETYGRVISNRPKLYGPEIIPNLIYTRRKSLDAFVKCSSLTREISYSLGLLIKKIAAFVRKIVLSWYTRHLYILKKLQCCAHCSLASLKMMKVRQKDFWHEIGDIDVNDMWFQQDRATCHTSREMLDVLHEKFASFLIKATSTGCQHHAI